MMSPQVSVVASMAFNKRSCTLTASAIIAAFLLTPARADFIGGRIGDAPASSTSSSANTSPASDKATQDLIDFLHKQQALADDDVPGRVALAQWALDRQMYTQASQMAREALSKESDNRPAYRILQQVDNAVQLPLEPKTEAALKAEFKKRYGRDFKTRNSRHFVLCYDTSDAFAAQLGGALEKSYDAFMANFTMNKLRPQFLDHRLVVILFHNRSDYLEYAQKTEGADLQWAAGYYSQRTNRSAFYDESTGAEAEEVAHDLGKYRAQLQQLNAQIDAANARNNRSLALQLTLQRNNLADALGRVDNRVGNTLGMYNSTKTTHEAAHQLAFNTGIQKRLVDYPLWFSEGLACSFEAEDHTGHRGPAILNPGRVEEVHELMAANKLMPLDKFIVNPRPASMSDDDLEVIYAEGWALFHYLYRTNRNGMEKFLDAYNNEKPLMEIPITEQRKIFTDSFGSDLDALDTQFKAYLRTLPTGAAP
ncbi:MAG TPA: DUF1570 domain-containing protein [Phycisphaerae bacterium]|nr:DUF1570 domain-containing protein [Phycisphaerae bacterium]